MKRERFSCPLIQTEVKHKPETLRRDVSMSASHPKPTFLFIFPTPEGTDCLWWRSRRPSASIFFFFQRNKQAFRATGQSKCQHGIPKKRRPGSGGTCATSLAAVRLIVSSRGNIFISERRGGVTFGAAGLSWPGALSY